MTRKKLFKTLSTLIVFIFLVNFMAGILHLYYSIWYFDMPMHFLGGVFLGLLLICFFYTDISEYTHGISLNFILKFLLSVLFIGVVWEVFEFIVNMFIAKSPFNLLDTISDVCFDCAGGFFVLLYLFKKYARSMLKNEI